jgi:hypothetical protein
MEENFTMADRLYPLEERVFNEKILPLILKETTELGGRPPKINHYVCFCAMLKMLSCSMPWRDCPQEYGPWHTIYTRFKRWSENGLFWKILTALKEKKLIEVEVIFMDSTTVKLHRRGSGAPKKKRGAERR